MLGAYLGPSFNLMSLMASMPLILTLAVSILICLRQRERRPRTARLIGWSSLAYLFWVTVGMRVYLITLHFSGLSFGGGEHGEIAWALKTIAITSIPATLHAVIWASALWAV